MEMTSLARALHSPPTLVIGGIFARSTMAAVIPTGAV
jgi:hypothetical protein